MADANLTERQQKWFAALRQGLERDTGRTLAEWVVIAQTCPQTAHRARLRWFKETHGLMQNRASLIIGEAFAATTSWAEPGDLIDRLWTDTAARTILEAVASQALRLSGTIQTARKGYVAWSRTVQYAALRPLKGGRAILGLAVEPDVNPRLTARGSQSWSERLTATSALDGPRAVDDTVAALLERAWVRS